MDTKDAVKKVRAAIAGRSFVVALGKQEIADTRALCDATEELWRDRERLRAIGVDLLWQTECGELHHGKTEYHDGGEHCPVIERLTESLAP